jgi:hypothetical protein
MFVDPGDPEIPVSLPVAGRKSNLPLVFPSFIIMFYLSIRFLIFNTTELMN